MIWKWVSGVALFATTGAISAVFFMWNEIGRIRAQEPLRQEQLREREIAQRELRAVIDDQLRLGIQLNQQGVDLLQMEVASVRERVVALEVQQ